MLPPKKSRKNIFLADNVKLGNFSGECRVKFRNFVNFIFIHNFGQRCLAPAKVDKAPAPMGPAYLGSQGGQENSAKLTNQRVSCAFTSSPFSFHVRHILPSSKFQNNYTCILLIFLQTSVNNMCENCDCECEYSTLVSRFLFRNPSE